MAPPTRMSLDQHNRSYMSIVDFNSIRMFPWDYRHNQTLKIWMNTGTFQTAEHSGRCHVELQVIRTRRQWKSFTLITLLGRFVRLRVTYNKMRKSLRHHLTINQMDDCEQRLSEPDWSGILCLEKRTEMLFGNSTAPWFSHKGAC